MIPRLQTIVLVLTLALCLVRAAASPIEGVWEGSRNGVKAAQVTIVERDGLLTGSAVFYIIRDNGDGTQNGAPLPPEPLHAVQWDGRTLRFSITGPDGTPVPFDMRLIEAGRAELRRRGSSDPDESVQLLLRK
jgi:hypothetical protein